MAKVITVIYETATHPMAGRCSRVPSPYDFVEKLLANHAAGNVVEGHLLEAARPGYTKCSMTVEICPVAYRLLIEDHKGFIEAVFSDDPVTKYGLHDVLVRWEDEDDIHKIKKMEKFILKACY